VSKVERTDVLNESASGPRQDEAIAFFRAGAVQKTGLGESPTGSNPSPGAWLPNNVRSTFAQEKAGARSSFLKSSSEASYRSAIVWAILRVDVY